MKIAIIGTGMVGGALGTRWSQMSHKVMYGVRDLHNEKAQALVNENTELAGIHEACAWADVVVLAVPYDGVSDAIAAAGSLKGKILLDATNPLVGLEGLKVGHTTSAAEQVRELALGANVVKIFNTTGYNIMADTHFDEYKPVMFYAGDDKEAKTIAHNLAFELGFDPIDAGELKQARLLEPLALLWITLAYSQGLGREMAFRVMKR